jgi:hypothetical protein
VRRRSVADEVVQASSEERVAQQHFLPLGGPAADSRQSRLQPRRGDPGSRRFAFNAPVPSGERALSKN